MPVRLTAAAIGLVVTSAALADDGLLARYSRARSVDDTHVGNLLRNFPSPDFPDALGEQAWIQGGKAIAFYRANSDGVERLFVRGVATGHEQAVATRSAISKALSSDPRTQVRENDTVPLNKLSINPSTKEITYTGAYGRWRICAASKGHKLSPESVFNEAVKYSPDGNRVAFVRGGDLYVQSTKGGSAERLTNDAVPGMDYAQYPPGDFQTDAFANPNIYMPPPLPQVLWSPDSRHLLTYRLDERSVPLQSLLQYAPPGHGLPRVITFRRTIAGGDVAHAEYMIFDVQDRRKTVFTSPAVELPEFSPFEEDTTWWSNDSSTVFFLVPTRDSKSQTLWQANQAGIVTPVLTETNFRTYVARPTRHPPIVDPRKIVDLPHLHKLIWFSERTNYGHLYLYDLKQPDSPPFAITSGNWRVRRVLFVDEHNQTVYFTASGREEGENPYFEHLYRVDLDGSNLRLITASNSNHVISFSPDGAAFVDQASRPDEAATVALYNRDGGDEALLYKTDVTRLASAGWKPPEMISGLAADNETMLYGVLYHPADEKPGVKYPIIDYVYPGPHRTVLGSSFGARDSWRMASLAQLGFFVVAVDGRGTPWRSKSFHDAAYGKNFAEHGLPDHIAIIKNLAGTRPDMDIARVGITGTSAGGGMTVFALLNHGDFFKAGVAGDASIDQSIGVAGWPERYIGMPKDDPEGYELTKSFKDAGKLTGSLLLSVCELDGNVLPGDSIRLADSLTAAGKEYEFVFIPSGAHGCSETSPLYKVRMWNFFVEKLRGELAPAQFSIEK